MIDVKDFDSKEVQEAIKKVVYKSLKEMLNEIKPGDQLGVLVYQLVNEFKEFSHEINDRVERIEKNMATKDDLKDMATKNDLNNMASKIITSIGKMITNKSG